MLIWFCCFCLFKFQEKHSTGAMLRSIVSPDSYSTWVTMGFDVWVPPYQCICGQPISGIKAHVFPFHLKEISGFAQRQPNLDISNKASSLSSLPPSLSLLHIHSHICTLFKKGAVLIQKPKLWEKGIVEASDWRDRISGKPRERERERGVYGWERSPKEAQVHPVLKCFDLALKPLTHELTLLPY